VGSTAAVTGLAVGIERQTDAVAIGPWVRGENGDRSRDFHAAALQCFAQDGLLESELVGIAGVLVVASTAGAEDGAQRWDALGGRLENSCHFCG